MLVAEWTIVRPGIDAADVHTDWGVSTTPPRRRRDPRGLERQAGRLLPGEPRLLVHNGGDPVGILPIRPTTGYLRWSKALDGDAGAFPAAAEISSARPAIHHQLAAFTTVPVLAALMARGIGP